MTMLRLAYVSFTLVLVGLLAGCGHHKQARVDVPVPPTIEVRAAAGRESSREIRGIEKASTCEKRARGCNPVGSG